jgi:hypothetical protein
MVAGFHGEVVVQWLTHDGSDRKMQLTQPFAFEDPAGLRWDVPVGTVVDGASIPQVFWTTFGPPFVGDYRRASVVHDHFCDVKTRPSEAVHHMFHEACLAGGVSTIRAKSMYLAVRTFGPSWASLLTELALPDAPALGAGETIVFQNTMELAEFDKLLKWIEVENPSIEEIDQRAEARTLRAPVIPRVPIERPLPGAPR